MGSLSFWKIVGADRLSGMALGLAGGGVVLVAIGVGSAVLQGRIGFFAVAVGGVVLAALGAVLLRARMSAVRGALGGRVTRATVIELMASGSKARVRYRFDVDGTLVEGAQTAWFDRMPAVGELIEVAFEPRRPQNSVVLAPFR